MTDEDQADYVRWLSDVADAHVFIDDGDLQRIIETHDVVFGLWPDADQPHGVRVGMIKGDALLHNFLDGHKAPEIKVTAISCDDEEEAMCYRQVFGELNRQH
jgi:hypothetical protein